MAPEKQTRFLWLDVETTGLDTQKDLLLEVAWWPSRSENPLDLRESDLRSRVIHVDGEMLGRYLSAETWAMHGKSGLLADVIRSSATAGSVARDIVHHMHNVDRWHATNWHLAGNSVHFDLNVLRGQVARFAEFDDVKQALHHRILDVSSFKLAATALGYSYSKADPAHRATADVRASVLEYARLLHWMLGEKFIVPADSAVRRVGDAYVLATPSEAI